MLLADPEQEESERIEAEEAKTKVSLEEQKLSSDEESKRAGP